MAHHYESHGMWHHNTGKTHGDLAYIHRLAWHYPKSRHLICRATRVSMTESLLKTWEEQILGDNHPAYSGNAGRANRHSYDFPNRSTVVVGGLDNPEKLFSTEWDTVLVGEAIEVSEDDWEKLGRAMRNGRMPYHQRIAETNPGSPGHWLNNRARPIDDGLRHVATPAEYDLLQAYNAVESPGRMRRLVSKHQDNPAYWDMAAWDWSTFGREYVLGELAGMTGHRRARLFEGRWVAAEGSVFAADFDEQRNTCPAFTVPSSWPVWMYLDPGYDHPCGAFWLTMSPTGRRFVVAELYEREMSVVKLAARIRQVEETQGLRPLRRFMDPNSGWSKSAVSDGVALIERYQTEGFFFIQWPRLAGKEKDAGVDAVRKALNSGMLVVSAACPNMLMELQSWSYKRNAKGERPPGDDQYEDRLNDLIDGLIGSEVRGHRFDEINPLPALHTVGLDPLTGTPWDGSVAEGEE